MLICLFVIFSQNYLINNEKERFLRTTLVFLAYTQVGMIISAWIKPHLVEFMMSMGVEDDLLQEMSIPRSQPQDVRVEPKIEKKEKKVIEIPEFLFKYSSTFFKTATKKDILVKKYFGKKKDLKKTSVTVSDRFKNSEDDKDKSGIQGKAIKKTDLSI